MTTQVTKIRSTIVKSVAAAVLVAACTLTSFADTTDFFADENAQNIEVSLKALNESLNSAISESTGVEDVEAYIEFSSAHGKQIKSEGTDAIAAMQAELLSASTTELFAEFNVSLDESSIIENEVMAENNEAVVTIFPSIASVGQEYEESIKRAIHIAAIETLDYAFDVSFSKSTGLLE